MNDFSSATILFPSERQDQERDAEERGTFRTEFERAICQCTRWGFSIEECFGMIWEETLEKITLSEDSQPRVYNELIEWAKRRGEFDPCSARESNR